MSSIEQTIEALINQKNIMRDDIEHIIVDGGSTDKTLSILNKYPNLKIISESDNGFYDAINKGIKISNGQVIGISNSDDWYQEDALFKIKKTFLSNKNIGLVHGNMNIWKNNEFYEVRKYKSHRKYYGMWILHPACLIKKEIYDKFGLYNQKYSIQGDYDYILRLNKNKVIFKFLPEIITNFRLGGMSHIKWSFSESVLVRKNNGWNIIRAIMTAIAGRLMFELKLIIVKKKIGEYKFTMADLISERTYQKTQINKIKSRYLETDTLDKVLKDPGYRFKVELIEKELQGVSGKILDLGANTCGEAEYLVNKGFDIIAGDINECALSISSQRCKKFNYNSPNYFAFDAHRIPFEDNSFDCIIAVEVLHHFEKLDIVLNEISRVLKNGGKLITLEPYAWNPYRRLSELPHFLFTGSIERSFTKKSIVRFLDQHNFNSYRTKMIVLPNSDWKLKYCSKIQIIRKTIFYKIFKLLPSIFGLIFISAIKKGEYIKQEKNDIKLICPMFNIELIKVKGGYMTKNGEKYYIYPILEDIPVIIIEDIIKITKAKAIQLLDE